MFLHFYFFGPVGYKVLTTWLNRKRFCHTLHKTSVVFGMHLIFYYGDLAIPHLAFIFSSLGVSVSSYHRRVNF